MYDLTWNGHSGKAKKLFIRNAGSGEVNIYSSALVNINDRLNNVDPQFVNSQFYHHMYAWKILPLSVSYQNANTFNLFTHAVDLGTGEKDLEIFPPFTINYYPNPFFYPTYLNGNQGSFSLISGPLLTNPININEFSQPLMDGINLRDYYRFKRRFRLENYSLSGSQVEFDIGCFSNFPSLYEGQLKLWYSAYSNSHEFYLKSFTLNLKLDISGIPFEEIDFTQVSDIFSVEGAELQGDVITIN
jgi:hypothetical protein